MYRHLPVILSLALGAASLCSANIDYTVDRTIGVGSVTGDIVTDGSVGTLNSSNILDWNLLLNDGTHTFDITGPLSGSNSQLFLLGSDLSATPNQLLFNFSGNDGGFALFQSPAIGSAELFYCPAANNNHCAGDPAGSEALDVLPESAQFQNLSGNIAIGTAGVAAPEPSYIAVGAGIIALIGFLKLKAKQRQLRAE